MSNMSYCRFENTSGDFSDCCAALDEFNSGYDLKAELSETEYSYVHELADQCREYLSQFDRLMKDFQNKNLL